MSPFHRPRVAVFVASLLLLAPALPCAARTAPGKAAPPAAAKPAALLRFGPHGSTTGFYVEVYMRKVLAGGALSGVRASLRDTGKGKRLLSTTVEESQESTEAGSVTNFRIPLDGDEKTILENSAGYKVFVDSYPTAGGNADAEIAVDFDVNTSLETSAGTVAANKVAAPCPRRVALDVEQSGDTQYGRERLAEIQKYLSRPDVARSIGAEVRQDNVPAKPRTVRDLSRPQSDGKMLTPICFDFTPPPPPGDYTLALSFPADAPFELRGQPLELGLVGPNIPNPTADERSPEDFLDLGLSLTSSVEEQEQPDKTTRRVRTTRGVSDLFFAPVLNMRTVGTLGDKGGWVQVFTPFFIDSKVSTGKITKDTLSLNTVVLGSDYEFRHYLNTHDYPDLLRHSLDFKHTSDRDFKQDEVKFVYEFQPIIGAINRPLGSAPNILNEQVVPNTKDRFGMEIVPTLGVELGRTYRVRDPKEFEGVSRNVRRFYAGLTMNFDLTKFVRLSLNDLFYVRGESPGDRLKNYFNGTIEAPLAPIGNFRAGHALFFSFERGQQPPFDTPSVNVLKFGYRVRARGILFKGGGARM